MTSTMTQISGLFNTTLQLDAKNAGPVLKNESGAMAVRNATDLAYAVMRGANPSGDMDLVNYQTAMAMNKLYVVTAQFDGGNPLPANTGTAHFIVVTTTGINAAIGDLLWDDGSSSGTATKIAATAGRGAMFTTAAFAGGTVSLNANSLYVWNAGSGAWLQEGSTVGTSGAVRCITVAVTTANASSTQQIPATADVLDCRVNVTGAYDAGSISVGYTTAATAFQDGSTDNIPTAIGLYDKPQITSVGASPRHVLVTVAGATTGAATAYVFYTNADV